MVTLQMLTSDIVPALVHNLSDGNYVDLGDNVNHDNVGALKPQDLTR